MTRFDRNQNLKPHVRPKFREANHSEPVLYALGREIREQSHQYREAAGLKPGIDKPENRMPQTNPKLRLLKN